MFIEKKISKNGILVVPKYMRMLLDIKDGQRLKIEAKDGKLIIQKR